MITDHAGEREVQRLAGEGGPGWGSAMFDGEVGGFARFLREQRLVAISGAAPDGAMWSTVLTGDEGFIDVPDDHTMVINARPPVGDPLRDAFDEPADLGAVVMAPQALRRVKVAGTAHREGDRLIVHTEQVLGNCPKYLQLRSVVEEAAGPAGTASASRDLSLDQQALIRTADTFFIGSRAAGHGADANHRGGQPGFVTVLDERRISWPDYVGNSFFMTLGNLQLDPRSGLVFLDWGTGRTLQLTGTSRINWDGTDRTVEFEVAGVVDIEHASPLRWQLHAYSRFNPPA